MYFLSFLFRIPSVRGSFLLWVVMPRIVVEIQRRVGETLPFSCFLILAPFLLGLLFENEDECSEIIQDNMALQTTKLCSLNFIELEIYA
jgi:hypothetical protein